MSIKAGDTAPAKKIAGHVPPNCLLVGLHVLRPRNLLRPTVPRVTLLISSMQIFIFILPATACRAGISLVHTYLHSRRHFAGLAGPYNHVTLFFTIWGKDLGSLILKVSGIVVYCVPSMTHVISKMAYEMMHESTILELCPGQTENLGRACPLRSKIQPITVQCCKATASTLLGDKWQK